MEGMHVVASRRERAWGIPVDVLDCVFLPEACVVLIEPDGWQDHVVKQRHHVALERLPQFLVRHSLVDELKALRLPVASI